MSASSAQKVSVGILDLPDEILFKILYEVFITTNGHAGITVPGRKRKWKFATCVPYVCKRFHRVAAQILYSSVVLETEAQLIDFLNNSDKQSHRFIRSFNVAKLYDARRPTDRGRSPLTPQAPQAPLPFGSASNLTKVKLSPAIDRFLTYEGLKQLLTTPRAKLQYLDMSGIDSEHFGQLWTQLVNSETDSSAAIPLLSQLRGLSLHGCSSLPSEVFAFLVPELRHINKLDLSKTAIEAQHLVALLTRNPQLELTHLCLVHCISLWNREEIDVSVFFFSFLSRLPRPDLCRFLAVEVARQPRSGFSTALFRDVLHMLDTRGFTDLRYLNLSRVIPTLSDEFVASLRVILLKNASSLASLFLRGIKITPRAILSLVAGLPALRFLDMSCNPAISAFTLKGTPFLTDLAPSVCLLEIEPEILETIKPERLAEKGWHAVTLPGSKRSWIVRESEVESGFDESEEPNSQPETRGIQRIDRIDRISTIATPNSPTSSASANTNSNSVVPPSPSTRSDVAESLDALLFQPLDEVETVAIHAETLAPATGSVFRPSRSRSRDRARSPSTNSGSANARSLSRSISRSISRSRGPRHDLSPPPPPPTGSVFTSSYANADSYSLDALTTYMHSESIASVRTQTASARVGGPELDPRLVYASRKLNLDDSDTVEEGVYRFLALRT